MTAETIAAGRAVLGIELGSTRIKACLVGDDPAVVIATGSHEWENQLVDGLWTYSLDDVWAGLRAAYADLVADVRRRYDVTPATFAGIGISAMMHGYLAFDDAGELLVPFRTWRNTQTGEAAAELSELLEANIPLRWSIAHLHHAVTTGEEHVARVRFVTTLAGYVHWQLTGQKVLGVGDASGMFPIGASGDDYDENLLARYDGAVDATPLAVPLRELLPTVLSAGERAGELTAEGASLLDPTGSLSAGIAFCPPEGDAGTGMVATNAVAPRTGNVSAGTSIFAMIVLERALSRAYAELDIVATPAGAPVAMVHCNNGASELGEWVGLFRRFADAAGLTIDTDTTYDVLFREAIAGEPDAGGLLAYNHLSGEPIVGVDDGRPLFVRTPDSRFTLANTMRAHLYGVFASLSLGMHVLAEERVQIDRMSAHGGVFRTAGVAQRFLAAALNTSVDVAESAAEGGAWGIAVLASYTASGAPSDLPTYLRDRVFSSGTAQTVDPDPTDVAGFTAYVGRYRDGLAIERAAALALPLD